MPTVSDRPTEILDGRVNAEGRGKFYLEARERCRHSLADHPSTRFERMYWFFALIMA
jgi:hypothetical protein